MFRISLAAFKKTKRSNYEPLMQPQRDNRLRRNDGRVLLHQMRRRSAEAGELGRGRGGRDMIPRSLEFAFIQYLRRRGVPNVGESYRLKFDGQIVWIQ